MNRLFTDEEKALIEKMGGLESNGALETIIRRAKKKNIKVEING